MGDILGISAGEIKETEHKTPIETSVEAKNRFKALFADDFEGMEVTTRQQEKGKIDIKEGMANLFADDFSQISSECNEESERIDGTNGKVKESNQDMSSLEKYDEIAAENNTKPGETAEIDETQEKKGGSYRDVKKSSDGETHEVHHMPADSSTDLERDDGPAIKMEKDDHRQTASCGNSREAREYREQQRELIKQGKFQEALQMDIDDIHEKFGDRYDDAIGEMLEYVDQLEKEGKING